MVKENLNHKESLPIFSNTHESLIPLIKRAEKISFKPYTYQEALNLLPDLKGFFNTYKNHLEAFSDCVLGLKKKESPDDFFHLEIKNHLTHKIGCFITSSSLNEQQREIANEGKALISKRYKNTGVVWNAIDSFWLNYLRSLGKDEKEFQVEADPFAILINFAEKGVYPRTDHKKFLVDIPILFEKIENGHNDYFYGCWSPMDEKTITQGHPLEQDCSRREKLANGELIIHNKINAQEQFNFYRPNG